MSRLACACIAVVLLATPACGRDREAALGVDPASGVSTWGFAPGPGEVFAAGTTPLHVRRKATLESVSLDVADGEIELLAARVVHGAVGSSCSTGPWPPAGYGTTEPAEGFTVAPGEERVALVVYMRARTPAAATRSVVVTYRDGGRRRTLRMDKDRVEVAPPKDGAKGDTCHDSPWFISPT